MTFNIMTFRIATFSIMASRIMKFSIATLSIIYLDAECRLCLASFMLNVTNKYFMLNVIMLSVVAP
jgi:hypothetical protein